VAVVAGVPQPVTLPPQTRESAVDLVDVGDVGVGVGVQVAVDSSKGGAVLPKRASLKNTGGLSPWEA